MDLSKQFDLFRQIFTNNGYTYNNINIKIMNPTQMLIRAGESDLSLIFDEKNGLPFVNYTHEVKIGKRVIARPNLTRKLIGVSFYKDRVVFLIEKFPDFTLMYSEIGV